MSASSVEEYIKHHAKWSEALTVLRGIINSTELDETIKWKAPVYTLNGKNVVGLAAFKNHFGVWFFNGVFLKDDQKLLVNAQEGITKALRQMRFQSIESIDEAAVRRYVLEAIENEKLGKKLTPSKTKQAVIPDVLKTALDNNTTLQTKFEALTPGRQREYCNHINSAKRESTKLNRLEKIKPMILKGMGLHDKHKHCQ